MDYRLYPTAIVDFTAPLATLTQVVADVSGFVVSAILEVAPAGLTILATSAIFVVGYRWIRKSVTA